LRTLLDACDRRVKWPPGSGVPGGYFIPLELLAKFVGIDRD
jgi:hypothetical protein